MDLARTRSFETIRISPARLRSVVAECEQLALPVRRMRLELQRVAVEMGWVLPDGGASPGSQEVPLLPLLDPASRGTSVEH